LTLSHRLTRQLGRIAIEQDDPEMRNFNQEIQDVPAGHVNRVRMAFVESTSNVATVDSQNDTVEDKQVKWWALALPALALMFIIASYFLNAAVASRAEAEESGLDGPFLLAASTSSKRPPGKFPNKASVSSIAYGKSHAVAFINDQMVSEGAVVDGMTVLKIHENAVQFEKDGKQWTQEVGQ